MKHVKQTPTAETMYQTIGANAQTTNIQTGEKQTT